MSADRPRLGPSAVALALGLALAACGPDYETEQLRITLADDAQRGLCAGDLHLFQSEVDRIEAALGLRMTKPLDLVYSTVPKPNEDGVEGHYSASRHRAETNEVAVSHELVHAVFGREGSRSMDDFFFEGIAEALNGKPTRMPRVMTRPSDNVGRELVRYDTAGHFVRWLYEEQGVAAIRQLGEGRGFSEVYGESIEAMQARWWDTAPWLYPAPEPCPFAPLDATADGWEASVVLSCDDDDVRSHGVPGLFTCRTFEVETEGLYLYTANVHGHVERCQQEIIEVPPAVEREAVPAAHDHNRPLEFLESDQEHEVLLRAGLHMTCFGLAEDDPVPSVEIRISSTATTLVRP